MIKFLIGVVLLTVAGVIAVFVVVVSNNRDQTAVDLKACVKGIGLSRIDGVDSLGPSKQDLAAGTLGPERQVALKNGGQATIFVPRDGSYTLVAVTVDEERAPVLLSRIERDPSQLAGLYLARTDLLERSLRDCVAGQAAS